MDSSLFTAKNVIVQGITGAHGTFHTRAMLAAGTSIVAGTSPNKAGQFVDTVPVYGSIAAIKQDMSVDISIIFVPAPQAKQAILEAITEAIPLIVCITEGIPVHDMLAIKKALASSRSILIGPNCPGVLLPGVSKLGIIPASLGLPGNVGIVSRSGTLTYEAAAGLSAKHIGQRAIIGIGGDRVHGIGFTECLALFEQDSTVDSIVLIGEVGGTEEIDAAEYISDHVAKPVFSYIAGHCAPKGIQLGHAGAILGSQHESASSKTKVLQKAGAHVFASITELVNGVATFTNSSTNSRK